MPVTPLSIVHLKSKNKSNLIAPNTPYMQQKEKRMEDNNYLGLIRTSHKVPPSKANYF
jgi:hypothetical protein